MKSPVKDAITKLRYKALQAPEGLTMNMIAFANINHSGTQYNTECFKYFDLGALGLHACHESSCASCIFSSAHNFEMIQLKELKDEI